MRVTPCCTRRPAFEAESWRGLAALWLEGAACCGAQGHGVCDHNDFERWANILTSLPYAAVGFHTFR